MAKHCLLYYITDRTAFPGSESERRHRLLDKIHEAAKAGVDYIQLREKDLATRELESLARDAVRVISEIAQKDRGPSCVPALVINSRSDVALAVGADGVHLRSDDVSPEEVREVFRGAGALARQLSPQDPLIAVSCHSPAEVAQAAASKATFAVFAPVFEKKVAPSQVTGLTLLEQACKANIPVVALGGITLTNARSCLDAGADGIAAIRLFQENDIAEVAHHLRNL